jgi:hypothetical protein
MTTTPYMRMEEIDATRERAGQLVDQYLRKSGWEHTCQTPGSYWMWRKEIDGTAYLVDTSSAEQFQRELDYREMRKQHDPVWHDKGYCIVCGDDGSEPESSHVSSDSSSD